MSMPMLTLTTALAAASMGSRCDSKYVAPPTGPGTEYPCGLRANLCSDHKSCCPLDYDCGDGFHGCPADACCYGGSSMMAERRDGGATEVRKARIISAP